MLGVEASAPELGVVLVSSGSNGCGDDGAAAELLLARTGVLGGDEEVGSGKFEAGMFGLLDAPDEVGVAD